jgi:hypothetical protein
MKLYGKVQRRIYLMKDSGRGPMLVPDYRNIYSVYPDKPTEIPDDIAKMLLEQNPDILSKHPFLEMEEKETEKPVKIPKLSGTGHSGPSDPSGPIGHVGISGYIGYSGTSGHSETNNPEKISKSQVLEIPQPIKKESDEQKPKKEPIPEPELPKGKPIGKSPIPD